MWAVPIAGLVILGWAWLSRQASLVALERDAHDQGARVHLRIAAFAARLGVALLALGIILIVLAVLR